MEASGFLLLARKIAYAYSMQCIPLLEQYDIPAVSFEILMFLANNPEFVTAQEICDHRHIKKNLVSVHVDKLVAAGYLQRCHVAGDRRKVKLECTELAKPIIEGGRQIQERFFAGLTDQISESELEQHRRFLLTVEANAEKMCTM